MGLVWAVSLVLVVLAYFFTIIPQLKVKAQLGKELAEKQQLYDAAVNAAKEENKKELADEIDVLKSKLSDYAVEYEDSANLIFDISRIAADKQLNAFTIKATDQSREQAQLTAKNLQENSIDISFASNFREFATFLNALERHRPVVFIDRFKVLRTEKGENPASADMGLTIFVRKRPEG
jgi:hypothetical protein